MKSKCLCVFYVNATMDVSWRIERIRMREMSWIICPFKTTCTPKKKKTQILLEAHAICLSICPESFLFTLPVTMQYTRLESEWRKDTIYCSTTYSPHLHSFHSIGAGDVLLKEIQCCFIDSHPEWIQVNVCRISWWVFHQCVGPNALPGQVIFVA